MNEMTDGEERAAAEVCFMLASRLLYCEPDSGEVVGQVEERLFTEAPFGMGNESVRDGLAAMDAWCEEAAEDRAKDDDAFDERVAALKREWFRLFVGAGTPEAPCWESFYLEPNSQMFGKRTLEVRTWYKRYGLQIERLHSEPDDHLGLMLGFLGRLVALEAAAIDEGDAEKAAAIAKDQEDFLTEHVLPWLPAWRFQANTRATSGYFRGVADLVFGLCAAFAERFGIRYDAEASAFKKRADLDAAPAANECASGGPVAR